MPKPAKIEKFENAVKIFEKYYNDWNESKDYQLKTLFKQGWGGSNKDDGRLATGAIVAVMAILKDPSISKDLHSIKRSLGVNTETEPLPFKPEALAKIKNVINQKMRSLMRGNLFLKVGSQLIDFYLCTDEPSEIPDWVRNFYYASGQLLLNLYYLFN